MPVTKVDKLYSFSHEILPSTIILKILYFLGWPYDGRPVDILSNIAGFHLKMEETTLEKNIANWAVSVVQLSRNRRHLDRAAMLSFWEKLDKHIIKHKPHLRW